MTQTALTRDDFVRVLFAEDFFAANPAFAPVQQTVAECQAAYQASAKSSRCRCGGETRLLFGCLDATLALMETMKTEHPAALVTLVNYVGVKRGKPGLTAFTLYYRKTAKEPLRKVRFP